MNKNRFIESLKYFTVLFHMKTNYFKYFKALFLYKLKHKVEFPEAIIKLHSVKFQTRKNSMDIAHLSNFYERDTTNLLLNLNPKVFVDVGAHIGRFSVLLTNENSKVISIEPSKSNYDQLNKNVKLNNLGNKIETVNVACYNKNENKTIYFSLKNEGQTSFKKTENSRKEIVKVKKLDKICENLNLKPEDVDIIKIDVEGFELKVLKGALNILKKGHPLLIIEITDKENKKSIKAFLKKFGFLNKEILDSRNFIFVKS